MVRTGAKKIFGSLEYRNATTMGSRALQKSHNPKKKCKRASGSFTNPYETDSKRKVFQGTKFFLINGVVPQ